MTYMLQTTARICERVTIVKILLPQSLLQSRLTREPTKIVGILSLTVTSTLRKKINDQFQKQLINRRHVDVMSYYNNSSYFPESYADWLRKHNILTVPLDTNMSDFELISVMDRLDGLLLTGGSTPIFQHNETIKIDTDSSNIVRVLKPSFYAKKVAVLVAKAKQINKSGRVFPIWATCLGFESLLINESKYTMPLNRVSNIDYSSSVYWENDTQSNFKNYFGDVALTNLMSKEPLFYFNHKFGFYPETFKRNKILNQKYRIVAKTMTRGKREIIAFVESVKYPFYASQYHPEKIEYEVHSKSSINRSEHAKEMARQLAQFFINNLVAKAHKSDIDYIEDVEDKSYEMFRIGPVGVFDELIFMHGLNRR